MKIFTVFPLLIVPVAIYNVIAWSGHEFSGPEAVRERMNEVFLHVPMASDALWTITPGHALIAITCLLYTSPSPRDATLSRMPSSA